MPHFQKALREIAQPLSGEIKIPAAQYRSQQQTGGCRHEGRGIGAGAHPNYEQEFERAGQIIKRSRGLTQMMMETHFIAGLPPNEGSHDADLETIKSAY